MIFYLDQRFLLAHVCVYLSLKVSVRPLEVQGHTDGRSVKVWKEQICRFMHSCKVHQEAHRDQMHKQGILITTSPQLCLRRSYGTWQEKHLRAQFLQGAIFETTVLERADTPTHPQTHIFELLLISCKGVCPFPFSIYSKKILLKTKDMNK